jgi:hypothetical protein
LLFPAVAIGVNDLIGTGVYGGEFVVASKKIGDVDTTLGLGWGRLGSANGISNPFGLISNSFKMRNATNGPGTTNFGSLFHGPKAGIFGGVRGSFDKGLIIRIPLGWSLTIQTQSQLNMDLRPVQRDGGQRMTGDTILFDETRRSSPSETY